MAPLWGRSGVTPTRGWARAPCQAAPGRAKTVRPAVRLTACQLTRSGANAGPNASRSAQSDRARWPLPGPPPAPGRLPRQGRRGVNQNARSGTGFGENRCPIDPLPEVAVFHRHHLAEMLPLPVVVPPLGQTLGKAAVDVTAGSDQCHAGGLGQGLETADDGQQFQTFAADVGLFVVGLELVASVNRLKDKSPLSPGLFSVGFRKQQEMWFRCVHRGFWGVLQDACRSAGGRFTRGVRPVWGRPKADREGFCSARPVSLIGSSYPTPLL